MPSVLVDSHGVIEDPRSTLQKLRRRELEAILRAEGIDAPQDIPADAARQILRSSGVNVDKYLDRRMNFIWPEKTAVSPVDYESMNMGKLRSVAAKLGLSFNPSTKKHQLIETIRAYENGEPA